jgi:hypothetical protein
MRPTTDKGGAVKKGVNLPHAKRRGWLKNGNPPGDPSRAPRCGAHSRLAQRPCLAPAMRNGRCRMHGGKSTGPRTEGGKVRARSARLEHGLYSKEAKSDRKEANELIRAWRKLESEF